MKAHLRRSFTGLMLVLAAGISCQFLVDVDGLSDQTCPANQKPCPTLKRCVATSDPETGCANPSCAPCPVPAHVQPRCTGSGGNEMCMTLGCIPPYGNCDTSKPDCETDLAHNPDNCGFCGNVCKTENGFPGCSEQTCRTGGCQPNFGDCDGQNGCETNHLTSGDHCGVCGHRCPTGTTCTGGVCL